MKFKITIDLGNDTMQTYADLSISLSALAAKFSHLEDKPNDTDGNPIRDINGNTVGRWYLC
jgi:hypothetical protein